MKTRRGLYLLAIPAIIIASSCEDIDGDMPKSPRVDESTPARIDASSTLPNKPGIDPGSLTPKKGPPDAIDYNDGDEQYEGDDMFYICLTLGEESDRCDEWLQDNEG